MTSDELIESGLCDDLGDVLYQFPLEFLDDFGGLSQLTGPCACVRCGRGDRATDSGKGRLAGNKQGDAGDVR